MKSQVLKKEVITPRRNVRPRKLALYVAIPTLLMLFFATITVSTASAFVVTSWLGSVVWLFTAVPFYVYLAFFHPGNEPLAERFIFRKNSGGSKSI